jgi:hypothetical protein
LHTFRISAAPLLLILLVCVGCSGVGELSSTEPGDTTDPNSYPNAESGNVALLSAFYGLDDAIPFFASYRICGEFGHQDGMPAIFSEELDVTTVQAGDFRVTLADGQQVLVDCATPAPAEDPGEFRTILLIGDFGSISNQPVSVEITGNIISMNQQANFKGASVQVTPLEQGPTLVRAEIVPEDQWELGKEASALPFGGGDSCPASTRQVVRAVWAGGVTKPGGDEIDQVERSAYQVIVADDHGELISVTPFAIGDLGDGDNNHELCLDTDAQVVRVAFPEGLMTDPREDLNEATEILVSS